MAQSAGSGGTSNEGKIDKDRGDGTTFSYNKEQRHTSKVTEGSKTSNPNDVPGLSKPVSDPRLV